MLNRHLLQNVFIKMCVVSVLFLLTACGQTKYGAVKIQSIPPGAEVIDLTDDAHLGMTPLLVTWESDEDEARYATVELRKVGYVEKIASFWVKLRHGTKEDAAQEPQPVTVELKKRK